jgi:hypothetical protein
MDEKKRPPSLCVPAIRLDPETHALVRAEVRRRAIEAGETPRYGDVVRALVRDGLCLPPAHVEVGMAAAAEIAGVTVGTLLSLRGEGAPVSRVKPGGGRMYGLASLLRWTAADRRARRRLAEEVQAEVSDGGVSRG